jgi:hypothetical protein
MDACPLRLIGPAFCRASEAKVTAAPAVKRRRRFGKKSFLRAQPRAREDIKLLSSGRLAVGADGGFDRHCLREFIEVCVFFAILR